MHSFSFGKALLILTCLQVIPYASSFAQRSFYFNKLTVDWPEVYMEFETRCGTDIRYDLSKQNILLKENGRKIDDYNLWCPIIDERCCISTALVVDRTLVQHADEPQFFEKMKDAAKSFIDHNEPCDESVVISSGVNPQVVVPMTDDVGMLTQGITNLRSTNKSFLVDAIYQGIEEVITSGVQPCRVIIIFTDGNNSGERYSIEDCIGLALANKVRIFLVGIDASNSLSQLAVDTGGRYFGDFSSQTMEYIYSNVTTILNSICFPTCSIRYDASCLGGYQRTIELTLRDLSECAGGEITATKIYKLPSSYLLPLRVEEVIAKSDREEIPVRIFMDKNTFDTLDAVSFEVTYDSTVATFLRIETNGSMLDSGAVRSERIPQGVRIVTTRTIAIDSNNVFLTLIFRTNAFPLEQECPLEIRNWDSSQPCVYPKFTRGRITVLATQMGVVVEIRSAGSITLEQNYPNPFSDKTTIRYTLRDAGKVTLDVYDVFGRIVATLVDEVLEAGEHNIPFDVKGSGNIPSSSLPPGVYFYRLRRDTDAMTKMMIVR